MRKFLINISRGYKMHDYYDFAYKDLYAKHGIKTIIFFDRKLSNNEVNNDSAIECYKIVFYDSKEDLFNQIKSINKEEIFYINTFDEILIPIVHDIRIELGLTVSTEYKAFRNKHIQRDILKRTYPETSVKNIEVNIEKDNIDYYFNKLNFPYIIKPSSGVQSSGVALIENKNDLINYVNNVKSLNENMKSRGIENNLFLIEEFINGDMYTIGYFVDSNGNIFYTPIVKVNGAQKIGINDFFNYVRINGKIVDKEVSIDEAKIFVEKHVKAFGMKNIFIHHEFKKNTNGVLKTIEINARIGGYRLEMMQSLFGFNLLEMIFGISLEVKSDFSNAVFVFYPKESGILKGFNLELVEEFKLLNSFVSLKIPTAKIGVKVGLTKDGFGSITALRIKNKDLEQFKKDYKFIEDNYNNLIILKTIKKLP